MSPKKLRAIVILIALLLLILIIISTLLEHMSSRRQEINTEVNDEKDGLVYDFNETINLDTANPMSDWDTTTGTDYPNFGKISDYYANTPMHYQDDKLYIESYDGYIILSKSWMNEGYAVYINEPEFGEIEKFKLEGNSVSINYNNVKMKDVITYINQLAGLGFNDVVLDDRNNRQDYYIYSAKKEERTVTLNYEKGNLLISVF